MVNQALGVKYFMSELTCGVSICDVRQNKVNGVGTACLLYQFALARYETHSCAIFLMEILIKIIWFPSFLQYSITIS